MFLNSNAFNFMSFVQNNVDPRTGQYNLGIELPELIGNNLCGPRLPLRLNFSPMNDQDSGFGIGWALNLSQFEIRASMLSLGSGERFKVSDNGPGVEPLIAERKLESFHFHNESKPDQQLVRYRLVHKSGLVEVLEPQDNDKDIALPVRVLAPSGHGLSLEYERDVDGPRLVRVSDDSGRDLLAIDYSSNHEVLLDLHPSDDPEVEPWARYTLSRNGADELTDVVLPTDEQASWHFEYQRFGNLRCVSKVDNPLGGTERVYYRTQGHRFPPAADGLARWLPNVERHVVQPGAGQPDMVTEYDYSPENFLGYGGTGIVWSDDGLDNLYKLVGNRYEYTSTARYRVPGEPDEDGNPTEVDARTITRTFNRFHLLNEQVTRQDGCVETVSTTYHEVAGQRFENQPEKFQLPHVMKKHWSLANDPREYREENVTTDYDTLGNLTEEIQANGIRTVITYHPANPEGFVGTLESLTVHPADCPVEPGHEAAQTIRVRYQYRQLAPLPPAQGYKAQEDWLLRNEEEIFQVLIDSEGKEQEQSLQKTECRYLEDSSNSFLYGRMDHQSTTLNGTTARSQWKYKRMDDDAGLPMLLSTEHTYTAPGGTLQRKIEQIQHVTTGGLYQEQDLNGVITRYRHDKLNRMLEETVGADTTEAATRHYAYRLLNQNDRGQAFEEATDVKGVLTRTYLDGASRTLRQELETLDEDKQPQTLPVHYQARYDSLGNQSGETLYDHYTQDGEKQVVAVDFSFSHDGWGQRCKVERPDGVIEHRDFSPFGADGNRIKTWITSAKNLELKRRQQVSEFNRFDKPVHEYRLDGNREVGRHDYHYDGLGRSTKETLTLQGNLDAPTLRSTHYHYDAWGRMHKTQRPDDSLLERQFAAHSLSELTTLFQVRKAANGVARPVCKREFDGLERLEKISVGPRVEDYTYQGSQTLVHQRTAYRMENGNPGQDKRVITYGYKPQLTEQPQTIETTRQQGGKGSAANLASFDYEESAAITSAKEDTQGTRSYTYTPLGYLLQEKWDNKDSTGYHVDYAHSPQGRLLSRQDSDGKAVVHAYDAQGRIAYTRQQSLKAAFSYDEEGLLESTETLDEASGRRVLCSLQHDTLGREVKRTLSVDGGVAHELHLVWRDDDLLLERRLEKDGTLLLKENFEYDALNRLAFHDSEGTLLPCNAKGRPIISQQFDFDEQDNLTRCRTWFDDGEQDDADFTYLADGSFQLAAVAHTLITDYPARQAFRYDELGNALNDEWGRRLVYDSVGRLQEVRDADDDDQVLASYRYDGHDQLYAARYGTAAEVLRRYQGNQVDRTVQDGLLTHYLYQSEMALGLNQWRGDQLQDSRLLLSDAQGTVLAEYDADGLRPKQEDTGELHPATYSTYGERPEDNGLRTLLGFLGELRDEAFGWYMLGRGYRTYNPSLMRFHSPDSLAPEESGINPYLYCLGDPVNWRDPTGHRSAYGYGKENPTDRSYHPPYIDPIEKPKGGWAQWLGVGIAGLFLVISAVTMPWTAPLSIGYVVAIAGLGMQAAGVGLQVAAIYTEDENLANTFYMLSNALQIVGGLMFGIGRGMALKVAKQLKHWTKHPLMQPGSKFKLPRLPEKLSTTGGDPIITNGTPLSAQTTAGSSSVRSTSSQVFKNMEDSALWQSLITNKRVIYSPGTRGELPFPSSISLPTSGASGAPWPPVTRPWGFLY
ncbi:RHS repeat domain-containing protein [Pseudomonas sp. NFX1]|uniref:RHS repeat domain-containing protein n=1 Tax=Pseudomonas sp. NFX1 TaxID=2201355 RepID=UPI003DA75628